LSKEDLSKIDLESEIEIYVTLLVNRSEIEGAENNRIEKDWLSKDEVDWLTFRFKTKTGECLEGISLCENYDKVTCDYAPILGCL